MWNTLVALLILIVISFREMTMRIINFLVKLAIVIIVAFVLGIKDTAYDLVEEYGVSKTNIYVVDLMTMYVTVNIACMDFALSNIPKKNSEWEECQNTK